MPRSSHFESHKRPRRARAVGALVAALALLVAAGATGVARADDSPTAADDQYNQQPVLTPPTNTPSQQTPAAMTPATQSSPPAVTPPAQPQTPAAPVTTPSSTPSTPAAATQPPAAPKSTPQKPFTPPSVSQAAPNQTPTQSAAPVSGTQGQSLPFTGVPLFDVVLVGLGLIALGAVLRLPQSRFGKRS